jgi:predicted urease superfamily metal-dependent hydrolase
VVYNIRDSFKKSIDSAGVKAYQVVNHNAAQLTGKASDGTNACINGVKAHYNLVKALYV